MFSKSFPFPVTKASRPSYLGETRENGEGGIRTLGTLLGYGALAKRCFRPLSHLTKKRLREYEMDRMIVKHPRCRSLWPGWVTPASYERIGTRSNLKKCDAHRAPLQLQRYCDEKRCNGQ